MTEVKFQVQYRNEAGQVSKNRKYWNFEMIHLSHDMQDI